MLDFHENFLNKYQKNKKFRIDFEIDSNIESKGMTLALLNTNYTDFSDPPIVSKKLSAYNFSKNSTNLNNNTQLVKNKLKKSRNQEIQIEIEQNSLNQLNIIMQMENYPLRKDYILSILIYIAFTISIFLIDDFIYYLKNFKL